MKQLITLLAILVLSGCYTKKRAIDKFCKADTIVTIIRDTIVTPTIRTDTIFSAKLDTIILTKDKLTIRYFKIHDSVYLSGECIGDTIYYTKEVKVPITIPSPSKYKWWMFIVAVLFGALLVKVFSK